MEKELLCHKCRKLVPYTIRSRQREREEYTYSELYGTCDICGTEIYVPGLDDNNEKVFAEIRNNYIWEE